MKKILSYLAVSTLALTLAMPSYAQTPKAPATTATQTPKTPRVTVTHEGKESKEHYPGIEHAISALETAQKSLQKAERDFGGHRLEALKQIDGALKELHQALEYAKAHPDKKTPDKKTPPENKPHADKK